jgi:hypothetical protein
MDAISPVFAALGVLEPDALNDLARWLDGCVGPMRAADDGGDRAIPGSGRPARREA